MARSPMAWTMTWRPAASAPSIQPRRAAESVVMKPTSSGSSSYGS